MLPGTTELIVILCVALLVFGPKKLPEIARSLGKAVGMFRHTLDEVKREVTLADLDEEPTKTRMEKNSETSAVNPSPESSTADDDDK